MNVTCFGFLMFFECQIPSAPPPIIVCPAMDAWSKAYQSRLADEVEKLASGSAIARQVREHIQLRDRIRRCRQEQPFPARQAR